MEHPPTLDYQPAPQSPRPSRLRRNSARVVITSWIIVAGSFWFGAAHSSDRDPLQWTAAMFSVLALLFALVMTLSHWVVIVPAVRDRERRSTK